MTFTVKIFFCYAQEDTELLKKLKAHLRPLERQGLIEIWYDRDIKAGAERERELGALLEKANIILLLVSPDFMDSDYAYSVEMMHAMELHNAKKTQVIPIILRPVYWEGTPFGKLNALPPSGEPVTMWQIHDKAFFEITQSIRAIVEQSLVQRWNNEGEIYLKANQYDKALEAFEQALSLDSKDVKSLREKGRLLLKLKRYDEGLEALELALQLDPHAIKAYSRKDIVRLLLESIQEAANEERVASKNSNSADAMTEDEQYYLMILHRAINRKDQRAWELIEHYFHDYVLRWMHNHPNRDVALRYESEEDYVALAFERFWMATASSRNKVTEFRNLNAALSYLRVCLQSAVLDTIRSHRNQPAIPLPAPETQEPEVIDELWEVIKDMLPDEREKRLAYLLFYANLKPREIVKLRSEEFNDVQEIYRLRRRITDRLIRNADQFRKRLGDDEQGETVS